MVLDTDTNELHRSWLLPLRRGNTSQPNKWGKRLPMAARSPSTTKRIRQTALLRPLNRVHHNGHAARNAVIRGSRPAMRSSASTHSMGATAAALRHFAPQRSRPWKVPLSAIVTSPAASSWPGRPDPLGLLVVHRSGQRPGHPENVAVGAGDGLHSEALSHEYSRWSISGSGWACPACQFPTTQRSAHYLIKVRSKGPRLPPPDLPFRPSRSPSWKRSSFRRAVAVSRRAAG